MKIMNCTPHPINISLDGREIVFNPSGYVPRVSQTETLSEIIDDIPFVKMEYGAVEPLPKSEEETIYIVSALYATAYRAQYPNSNVRLAVPARPIRNEKGQIIGSGALAKI